MAPPFRNQGPEMVDGRLVGGQSGANDYSVGPLSSCRLGKGIRSTRVNAVQGTPVSRIGRSLRGDELYGPETSPVQGCRGAAHGAEHVSFERFPSLGKPAALCRLCVWGLHGGVCFSEHD